jgi:hypothetical protein
MRPTRDRDEHRTTDTMMTRTLTTNLAGRSSSMRRLRRRTRHGAVSANPLFCSTNGCATILVLDGETGVARCPVCGLERRVH